jgi:hypothetical protein
MKDKLEDLYQAMRLVPASKEKGGMGTRLRAGPSTRFACSCNASRPHLGASRPGTWDSSTDSARARPKKHGRAASARRYH